MSGTLLEQLRVLHADIERRRNRVLSFLSSSPRHLKEEILRDQRVRAELEQISGSAGQLLILYRDSESSKAAEARRLTGEISQVWPGFLERLRSIEQLGLEEREPRQLELDPEDDQEMGAEPAGFSGEEKFGKFVDLYPLYQEFLNLRCFRRTKYLNYLRNLDQFERADPQLKDAAYREYLARLLAYLMEFHEKIHPLFPVARIVARIEEHLEEELDHTGLFCKPCRRIFAKESVFKAHLQGKKHKKAVDEQQKGVSLGGEKDGVEMLEKKIRVFVRLLKERIVSTIQFVESMQTRTYQEIQAERTRDSDDENDVADEESEEDEIIYNPLNIPLGWDGKPIPYWLYKLHGLNLEYKCQICGDYSYWGPRAFEKHFNEWRHINALKAYGIHNSKDFKFVTEVQDALALHNKLQFQEKKAFWRPELDEEFEDDEGNVFNKKTFEDLKRQGLL